MAESPQTAPPGPGGFLPPRTSLPSPAPSTASSRVAALLPHPRSKPLVPGSRKEDYARDYVARRLLHISRRYVKKFGIPDPADEVTGYESMEEVCRDLEEVVDVLWFSGTPSLQVPYFLNIALAFNTYLPSFPPVPRPTFLLLRKIDHCFASLLVGYDVKTKDPLPGFSSTVDNSTKMRFSRTDMVRCKSLADETRMLVAVVMSGEVDVVDYDEDDELIAQRPARGRTEARSNSVEAPNSASYGFQGFETVKTEETDEDDNLDLNSENEESTAHTKRKAEDMSEDVDMTDQVPKHIKIEDEGDPGVDLSGIVLADTGSNSPAANNLKNNDKGQFHWALEEDDDSDDENQSNSTVSTTGVRNTAVGGRVLPSPPQPSGLNAIGEDGLDNDANEREDMLGEYDEEEEDEELHMNVGRVYQKTLVQLGQSLGESIIDD
ncbi:hypothetical protein E0Z10_g10163 [Xylaria hypoxylon]|uniref:Meiotic recombination protein DMC1 n=1 Tax=Xylaria hypoxylon TaxID=37992 RepID=A0A4Z0YIM6_9PEZI|nr:hypothetical protein E0Z10_g10163 [Xylaria hypoxylon]